MQKDAKIYIAGHRGLVGSALMRAIARGGYENVLTRDHASLDLTEQAATRAFLQAERPDYLFLAAAKVGGIYANDNYPAEFVRQNLAIQDNVIHEAWSSGTKRLLFLGSSCIYPRLAPQPIKEDSLLTGPLEATNRPYALAKIAGIEMCWSYNRQYGTQFLAVMPTNAYGPGDNYHAENSHVVPALIRKFHEAKHNGDEEVSVWGTGRPRRELLYSDDMADACLFLMNLPDGEFKKLLGSDESRTGKFQPPLVNIGVGTDLTIRELAELIAEVTGFVGKITFDSTKPDGTPRKLLDVGRVNALGWKASTQLREGLKKTYADFLRAVEKQV